MPELMVKNEYGDPLIYDGNYILIHFTGGKILREYTKREWVTLVNLQMPVEYDWF